MNTPTTSANPEAKFTPGWSAFSADWFTPRIPFWQKHILPVLVGKPVRWLELGSYEGRSALWTLDNILTHEESTIDCVDIWTGAYEQRFDANMAGIKKTTKHKEDCVQYLAKTIFNRTTGGRVIPFYDGIYIDADHQAKSALTDASMAWHLLKPGGFMIFDDYPWQHPKTDPNRDRKLGPKKGVDAFLECWQFECVLLHKEWQVIIQKLPPS